MWFFRRLKKILIVEDDDVMRRLTFERIHHLEKYVALQAADIATALKVIRKECPDYIILDLMLDNESGMELLQMMHEGKLKKIPTFVTTNDKRMGSVEEALKLGAVNYLIKPIEAAEISQIISMTRS